MHHAYNNRGVAKADLKIIMELLSDFTKAIEINPNDAKLIITEEMLN